MPRFTNERNEVVEVKVGRPMAELVMALCLLFIGVFIALVVWDNEALSITAFAAGAFASVSYMNRCERLRLERRVSNLLHQTKQLQQRVDNLRALLSIDRSDLGDDTISMLEGRYSDG